MSGASHSMILVTAAEVPVASKSTCSTGLPWRRASILVKRAAQRPMRNNQSGVGLEDIAFGA